MFLRAIGLALLVSFSIPSQAQDLSQFFGPLAYVADDDGHGSGFFTDATHVITAKHVLHDLKKHPYVTDSFGDRHKVTGIVASAKADVEMLTVDNPISRPAESHPVAVVDCRMPEDLEMLVSVGFPLNLPSAISPLMVSANQDPQQIIAIGTIAPGMSGGPVYGKDGKVVAITDAMTMFGSKKNGMMPSGFQVLIPLISVKELCIPVPGEPT